MNLRGRIQGVSNQLKEGGRCPVCGGSDDVEFVFNLRVAGAGGDREPEPEDEIPTCPMCGRAQRIVVDLNRERP